MRLPELLLLIALSLNTVTSLILVMASRKIHRGAVAMPQEPIKAKQ